MTQRQVCWLLLWITLLALPSTALGQAVTLGAKLGANFATIDVSGFQGEETRTAIVAGGVLGIGVSRTFGVQLETLYAQKGAKARDDDETERLWIDYVEVPVLVRVRVPVGSSSVRPVFYAGPTVAFEVSCTHGLETGGSDFEAGCREPGPVSELDPVQTASVDAAIALGGGIDVDLGRTILSFEVRYTNGFTNIVDEDTTEWKNRVLAVIMGLAVRLP